MSNSLEIERRKQLVGLLATNQRRVMAYVHTLVPNPHDAEDIFQETCEVICDKFDEFEVGTDFAAWACRIAWWRVRAARSDFARSKVVFNDRILELVAATSQSLQSEVDTRHEALTQCLKKLPDRDRALILTRYERGISVEEAAKKSGRSLEAAYKALTRIRKMLHECVDSRLATEVTA